MTITALKPEKLQASELAQTVKQIWRDEVFPCPVWQRGAMDAYCGRKPERISEAYLEGYVAQLQELPVDEKGHVEWFRDRPDGGWKLTDNL